MPALLIRMCRGRFFSLKAATNCCVDWKEERSRGMLSTVIVTSGNSSATSLLSRSRAYGILNRRQLQSPLILNILCTHSCQSLCFRWDSQAFSSPALLTNWKPCCQESTWKDQKTWLFFRYEVSDLLIILPSYKNKMFPHRPVHESLLVAGQLVSNDFKVIINCCMSNTYTRCCCLLAGYWITTIIYGRKTRARSESENTEGKDDEWYCSGPQYHTHTTHIPQKHELTHNTYTPHTRIVWQSQTLAQSGIKPT